MMMEDTPNFIRNRSLELKWAREQIKSLSKKEVRSFREKWLDTSDVLLALRISRRTLQKLRTQDLLPFVKLAGKLFYRGKDLDTLLTSRYKKQRKTKTHE